MRIGLDLDNTIVCYDDVFVREANQMELLVSDGYKSKDQVKEALQAGPDGERRWQTLQGKVYGPCMDQARLFPGVALFLMRCKARGDNVYVVSHKTEFGHFDPTRTRLRQAAIRWMTENGFFDPTLYGLQKENVFFLSTRAEKVSQIGRLDLDVFVDDLEEVLLDESFPRIKKILFGNPVTKSKDVTARGSWIDIGDELFGAMTDLEQCEVLEGIVHEPIASVSRASRSGNSKVFCVMTESGRKYAAKFYPDLRWDSRPRLQRESSAYRLLEHLDFTPKLVCAQVELNVGVFEWIEGKKPGSSNPGAIQSALEFTRVLKELYDRSDQNFPEASEACLSVFELVSQIENRLLALDSIEHQELQAFLRGRLRPLWKGILARQSQWWSDVAKDSTLPLEKQTLSPSDFGFHNAIEREDGRILFNDFEYFGRDDPVKLIADFLWHPGMRLTPMEKEQWIRGTFGIFAADSGLVARLRNTWAYYGVRWALIILNSFRLLGRTEDRKQSSSQIDDKFRSAQLQKASDVCNLLQEHRLECPYV